VNDKRCLLCPEPPEDNHHVTGRGPDGRYLDPKLVGPLCHDCHELVEEDNTAGAPDHASTETFLGSLELRLSRTAGFVGRVAATLPDPFATLFAWLASHLARWASRLHDSLAALDQNAPQWRTIPGV
jgi:hypothetical protein